MFWNQPHNLLGLKYATVNLHDYTGHHSKHRKLRFLLLYIGVTAVSLYVQHLDGGHLQHILHVVITV